MNIIIYNINSFGGNYEYAKHIKEVYSKDPHVENCTVLMPANAAIEDKDVLKLLIPDSCQSSRKLVKKLHFLYRSFVNPYRLFDYLRKRGPSVVLFNDFDQISAFIWAPFFRHLKKRHVFGVVLHDPDRDGFFPVRLLSKFSMRLIMNIMDIAFYHGYLPVKQYYNGKFRKVNIPHGIYMNTEFDQEFFDRLINLAGGKTLIGVLGNIREEKNYDQVFEALTYLDEVKLLIAGKPAHSGISVASLREKAANMGVEDKVIWIIDYLNQGAFNAAVKACEVILLYYKSSFASQSGILGVIAPFHKKLIISDGKSSLKQCVEEYGLGSVVPGNDIPKLVGTLKDLLNSDSTAKLLNWQKYMRDSSWEKHVSIAVEHYKTLQR